MVQLVSRSRNRGFIIICSTTVAVTDPNKFLTICGPILPFVSRLYILPKTASSITTKPKPPSCLNILENLVKTSRSETLVNKTTLVVLPTSVTKYPTIGFTQFSYIRLEHIPSIVNIHTIGYIALTVTRTSTK